MSYYSNQYQHQHQQTPPVKAPPPQGYYRNKVDAMYPPPPDYPHPPYASPPPYAPQSAQASTQWPEQQSIGCFEAW
ncbi:hypothetical protein SAY86_019910 [Trapa natans]|uniref:Uncharacterized protein n=1 Tax=Trapa natans TaxID=22666 RepID=A0AAN7LLQ7_TRANT|nr:hypothetical protein SAY86_019910 [Trapa natans]